MEAVWIAVGVMLVGVVVFMGVAGWRTLMDMRNYSEELEGMLKDCRRQFLYYEKQHRAKDTLDSLAKAEVNAQFAMRITETLEDY